MPGIVELTVITLIVVVGIGALTRYLIRLARRSVTAREKLLALERARDERAARGD